MSVSERCQYEVQASVMRYLRICMCSAVNTEKKAIEVKWMAVYFVSIVVIDQTGLEPFIFAARSQSGCVPKLSDDKSRRAWSPLFLYQALISSGLEPIVIRMKN